MNDFTKEELHKIFNFIQHHKQDSYDDMLFKNIENKIQTMIDNNDCQHIDAKWTSDIDYAKICDTCDKVLEVK